MWKSFYQKFSNMHAGLRFMICFCLSVFLMYQLGYVIGKLIAHIS